MIISKIPRRRRSKRRTRELAFSLFRAGATRSAFKLLEGNIPRSGSSMDETHGIGSKKDPGRYIRNPGYETRSSRVSRSRLFTESRHYPSTELRFTPRPLRVPEVRTGTLSTEEPPSREGRFPGTRVLLSEEGVDSTGRTCTEEIGGFSGTYCPLDPLLAASGMTLFSRRIPRREGGGRSREGEGNG